jgi:hypothetical protein
MSNQDEFVEVGGGETWKPENIGDSIQGQYVAKQEDVGPNSSNMYTLRTAEGDRDIWGSAVIDNKFRSLRIDQEVKVEFLGLGKAAPGKKPYKDFKVLAKPAANGGPVNNVPTAGLDDAGEINLDDLNY